MQQADALVLYSRFETFGCVLIEANACGIPVLVSDIEVFHELVENQVNGVFVRGDDPRALADAMLSLILKQDSFNSAQIALAVSEKYNFKNVGKQFAACYNSVSGKNLE